MKNFSACHISIPAGTIILIDDKEYILGKDTTFFPSEPSSGIPVEDDFEIEFSVGEDDDESDCC